MPFLTRVFGDANRRAVEKLRATAARINELEPKFERFSLDELRAKTPEFKNRLAQGETLDDILPEAFAAIREAAKRTLGQRHFDVQLIGGMVLHQGKIAEMKTGEGKTLVATLPAYLDALTGRGVHIVTVNDYLSRRDAVWMGQIYDCLDLTVGVLNHEASYIYDPSHGKISNDQFLISSQTPSLNDQNDKLDKKRDATGAFRVVHEFLRPVSRRQAYEADITYGTNNEFGFDYLRDNMVYDLSQVAQVRGHHYAIVDEIDSILIDEARTPLIISAPDAESTHLYETFAKITPRLKENEDYNVDDKLRAVTITEKGIEKVEQMLGVKNIYEEGGTRYVHQLEQALKANILFHRDKDYVVRPGPDGSEVIIVDEFTGRLMPGRRWSGGLHQAVEAKEKVLVQKESRTLATITFQNYFRLYQKLAGMTGTAQTSAEEFHKVYGLDVINVPTNKPMARQNLPDRIYKSERGKFLAVAEEVKRRHFGESGDMPKESWEQENQFSPDIALPSFGKRLPSQSDLGTMPKAGGVKDKGNVRHRGGQPVLVGTVSIAKNETLSAYLNREGIPHKILNAKNHEEEGEIIAQAGRLGAVTVATNMAGRGVDIILGGNPPDMEEAEKVKELGGLHVIGTERHEARRIDNQLRGRSGRQGDPGSSQFFISAEDELLRIFGGDRLRNLMERLGVTEEEAIENRFVSGAIEQAQTKVEGNNFDIRKYVLEYDDVMNKHRTTVYQLRREILESSDVSDKITGYIITEVGKIVSFHTASESGDWNIEEIIEGIKAMTGTNSDLTAGVREIGKEGSREKLKDFLEEKVLSFYHDRIKMIALSDSHDRSKMIVPENLEAVRRLDKMLLLRVIDELWVDHLEQMEYLRDSVRLRAYGQRDPLVEYKIEGQRLFNELNSAIGTQVANLIFKVGVAHQSRVFPAEEKKTAMAVESLKTKDQGQESPRALDLSPSSLDNPKLGRNAPCWCNSGKKYKKCHGR